MQERKQLTELFQRYQQGLVTEEEKTLIARWLVQLEVMGEQLSAAQLEAKSELSKSDLKNRFFPVLAPQPKVVRLPLWLKTIAASLFIAVALSSIFYTINKRGKQLEEVAFKQIVTKVGEMKTITLTDGSKITLNTQSRLQYPTNFNDQTREVYLVGEAFFDIAHNTKKPFKVHTERLNVQVLGTSFNISAYKEDKEIAVAVATGMVGVTSKNDSKGTAYLLLPGEELIYHNAGGTINKSKREIADIGSWDRGKFVFENETLANITRRLQRHYQVKFFFKNTSISQKQISLTTSNQNISIVMKAMSIAGGFHYSINGNEITVW
ncbi:DUF4974 domain-containing protein [Pedobacter polaris]|uniref:DUF4974 domain-containing protein n=1 Tax=Pedobacter polaris TaxID=2571273 RepID=A0A4U1CKA6_9SPHI|nr:FecR family protein [Pedobacter polaris]TKC08084.1 DUF4974 domain-containing protein [Pedobacter polaris]